MTGLKEIQRRENKGWILSNLLSIFFTENFIHARCRVKKLKQVSASKVDSNGSPAKCGVNHVSLLYSSDFREMLYRKRG